MSNLKHKIAMFSRSSLANQPSHALQTLAEEIYQEQIECTNAGLQHAQALCNHAALKALCAVKDEKYTKATAKFAERELFI